MARLVRPILAIQKGEYWAWYVLLDDVAQLGFLDGIHEQNLTGLEDTDLGDCLHIGLAVTDLGQDHLRCGEVDEGQANNGRDATRLADGTDDVLPSDTGSRGGWPTCWRVPAADP